jgi:hypothetical protein
MQENAGLLRSELPVLDLVGGRQDAGVTKKQILRFAQDDNTFVIALYAWIGSQSSTVPRPLMGLKDSS